MATYTTGGKAARALARLEEGPATMGDLQAAVGVSDSQARKLWHLSSQMMRDGLMVRAGCFYEITEAGAEALAVLRSGVDFSCDRIEPHARVFGPNGSVSIAHHDQLEDAARG